MMDFILFIERKRSNNLAHNTFLKSGMEVVLRSVCLRSQKIFFVNVNKDCSCPEVLF